MNGQQRPRLDDRPPLTRIGSNHSAEPPAREIHVIIRLPYARPPDAPAPPSQVVWSLEKERVLWHEISLSRVNSSPIDWTGLSTRLDVPEPYLRYRAEAKLEEDLRGLRQGPHSAGLQLMMLATSPTEERVGYAGQRFPVSRPGFPLSPNGSTPTALSHPRRPSSSGLTGSRISRISNGSTHTLVQPNSARAARLNPVLTPVRTATGSQLSSPVSTPSETDSEAERFAKEEAQREEADQLTQKLKDLQGVVGKFGFAGVRPRPPMGSPTPSFGRSQARSPSDTVLPPPPYPVMRVPPIASMSVASPSTSATSVSGQSSIPDIPSPISDSRTRPPVRPIVTWTGPRRSPSEPREPRLVRRPQESNQPSSISSFSSLGDDISESALEDAMSSDNFRSMKTTSRMSMLSRGYHPRS